MSITFAELGLQPQLAEAVLAAGYETPTPIQERAIPVLLSGKDIIGQAQTGTGKTAAYGLPLLQVVQTPGPIQALILTPTRELAIQVQEQLHTWSKQVRSLAVYGGQPIPVQFKALRAGVQVVVATPGRLIDHIERGSIELSALKYCVLDEADEMLDFGFEEELNTILEQVPNGCRMALFSATFPTKIKQLAGRHMADAQKIEIQATQRTVSKVEQFYCLVRPGKKARSLGRILDHQDPGPSLVFCRTRMETQQLTDDLRRRGYAAECLHGEMDQSERERVMDRFKQNQCRILVATDIAARGLDVDGITHVFNYDIPWDVEHYIHRVGRTARAGRSGTAITVIEPSQQRHLQRIERESGAKFQPYAVPTLEQISSGRTKRFAERIRQQIEDPACQEQLELVESLSKSFDPKVVAAAALQALWADSYSAMAEDGDDDLAPVSKSYVWMSVSVGRRDGMNPAELLQVVHTETGFGKMELGKIHIEDNRTLVEIPSDKADKMILDLRRARIKGKRVKVDLTSPPAGTAAGKGRKPFAGKPSFGDKPFAPKFDGPPANKRPKRNYEPAGGPAAEAPAGERPARDRAPRPGGEKPFRDKGPKVGGDRPFKGPKAGGDKPFRESGPKPVGDKFREKPQKGFPKAGKPGRPSASSAAAADGRKPVNKKGDKSNWVGGAGKSRKK
ncbi:MAG: DEAD/DEAH box helicase [Candidatus Eremiobacteraeota bacterium]|nr:DEAD/DEAH box helicase [Candidatus Eremiobacteraeota bacterium]